MRTKVRSYRRRNGSYVKGHTRKIHSAVDGDTIRVKRKINGSNYVRLVGFDTPEIGQKDYNKAKQQLQSLTQGKRLYINPVAKNQGRVIARVRAGRKDLSREMKKRGW